MGHLGKSASGDCDKLQYVCVCVCVCVCVSVCVCVAPAGAGLPGGVLPRAQPGAPAAAEPSGSSTAHLAERGAAEYQLELRPPPHPPPNPPPPHTTDTPTHPPHTTHTHTHTTTHTHPPPPPLALNHEQQAYRAGRATWC